MPNRNAKRDPNKAGPRLTDTERARVMEEVERMDNRGWTQAQIAREVGVTQVMVGQYLKTIRKRYHREMMTDYADKQARRLAQLREARREAWAAWERSKQDAECTTEEEGLRADIADLDPSTKQGKGGKFMSRDAKLKLVRRILKREGRLPAHHYLNCVIGCIRLEAEIEGLLEPSVKLAVINNNIGAAQAVDWSPIQVPLPDDRPDPIEQKLMEIERMIPPQPAPLPPPRFDLNGNGHANGNGKH